MKLFVLGLTVMVVLSASAVQAQTTVAEITDIEPDQIRSVGFELKKGAEVSVEAVGLGLFESRQWAAYGWMLDANTRQLVWKMRRGRSNEMRDNELLRKDNDVQFLEAGRYELYFSSYIPKWWRWDNDNIIRGIWDIFDNDDDRERYVKYARRDVEDCYIRVTSDELGSGDIDHFVPTGGLDNALIQHRGLGDSEYFVDAFELSSKQPIHIYAVFEFPESADHAADYAWIVNADTRRRVWEPDQWDVDHGGGGDKNVVFDDEVTLEAGSYILYTATDDSHSNDEFNVNPPYDPLNWGVSLLPGDGFDRAAFSLTDAPTMREPIIDFTRARDDDFYEQSFTVKEPTELYVRAIGEMSTGNGDFVDFGAIIDAKTGEPVWEMNERNTEHAGGGEKNRGFDGTISLAPGTYTAYYLTDGSHSYRDWNAGAPFDPEAYGLAIYPTGDRGASNLKLVNEEDLKSMEGVLARITRVGDHARRRARFTLDKPSRVRVYALGEGSGGEMYDYAYIIDLDSNRDVWEMRYRRTDHAGGAKKNRVFSDEIKLGPGNYEVVYESDGSHSFGRWNASPPRDAINWGVTVSLAP